jgi:alcohol dehydrogenase
MNENDVYDFHCPTRVYYRPNGLAVIGSILKKDYGFSKVYLVFGGKSFKTSGNYDILVASLKEADCVFKEHSGISANPDIADVRAMSQEVKGFCPDVILAVGGGSVMDAGKLLAQAFYYDGDPLDFNKKLVAPLHALPLATIPTLAASGSEMSNSCVISDRAHHFKGGFNSITNYPTLSLLDPTLTYSVPPYQTAIGLVDMFSHSFERYFSPSHAIEPCDSLALAVMKEIVAVSKPVLIDPKSYEARRAMMLLGTLSHNGITNFGKTQVFKVHGAEHRLSGNYPELAHGQGIALLLCDYLSINQTLFQIKIERMGREVFAIARNDASGAIEALRNWIGSLPLYHSFAELPFSVAAKDIEKAKTLLKIK